MKSIDSRLRKLLGHAPKHYFDDKIASNRGYWENGSSPNWYSRMSFPKRKVANTPS